MIDFYKADHRRQYPEGTTKVYSNFTPRHNGYYPEANHVVAFGLQYFIKEFLLHRWNVGFFNRPKKEAISEYSRRMDTSLGPDKIPVDHIEELHDLGHLPLLIKSLPEGTLFPIGVPVLTIENTDPRFFWLTNYLESLISAVLWKPMTSATTAYLARKEFDRHAKLTGFDSWDFTRFQGHDFSFRGMSGLEDSVVSGAAHLLSFVGTDTVSALNFMEEFYNANAENELIGTSVPATEHSVMSMGGMEDELGTFKRLITELYPSGIVSIVSDTWDFWKVLTEYMPVLKEDILARSGDPILDRVVIRPDSGIPEDILCGDRDSAPGSPEHKGAYQLLWDTFGGTLNEKGFRILNSKVGLIYGDSITLQRQSIILRRMEDLGFAASNLVMGLGSYLYSLKTRDSLGLVFNKQAPLYRNIH